VLHSKIGRRSASSVVLVLGFVAGAAQGQARSSNQASAEQEDEDIVVNGFRPGNYSADIAVAGKVARSPLETPQSVSVITKQRMEDQALVTVTDALNATPGVAVMSNDGITSNYRSRGFAMGISFDGIPAYNGGNYQQQLDLAVYERVEVLRGPAGIFQGSDNPGGVINLVRKRGTSSYFLNTAAAVARWDNIRGELDIGGPLNASGTIRARGVLSGQRQNYVYDYTEDRRLIAYGTLDWDILPSTTLSLSYANQDQHTDAAYSGLPAYTTGELIPAPRSTNVTPPWSRSHWRTREASVELQHSFGGDWIARARYTNRAQDFTYQDGYAAAGVNRATGTTSFARRRADFDYRRDAIDLYLAGSFRLMGQQQAIVLGYNRDQLVIPSRRVQAPNLPGIPFDRADEVPEFTADYTSGSGQRIDQNGLYGQLRLKPASWLTVVAGGRLSDFNSRTRDQAPSPETMYRQGAQVSDEFTPYGAVLVNPMPSLSIYASYSDLFIPQTLQRVDGTVLDPRIGRQYELGAKKAFLGRKLLVSGAVFNFRDRNRPFADPDNPGFFLPQGEIGSKGWEVEAVGTPVSGFDLQASYVHLKTRYVRDRVNSGLPYETRDPEHMVKLWAIRRFAGGVLEGLSLGGGLIYFSETQADIGAAAIRRQGDYVQLSAAITYQVNANLSVALNGANLADKTYYTRLGGINSYNSYGEPRNVILTARYKM
jgi:outer membrane receptor for ferric coprogen and ferric-rhodotorulic acid